MLCPGFLLEVYSKAVLIKTLLFLSDPYFKRVRFAPISLLKVSILYLCEEYGSKRKGGMSQTLMDAGQGFSLLMSVYSGEEATQFDRALDSVMQATLLPKEVVLVCDGPLTEPLEAVISQYVQRFPNLFRLIRLEKNSGLGVALNVGLTHCSYELVARMDADDVSYPERFERQVEFMNAHPEVGVLSATINDFMGEESNVLGRRELPMEHKAIYRFAKQRNPINHPVVIFRKSEVERVGGYEHCPYFEDYYLWVRMLLAGSRFHNLKESLLAFRMDKNALQRRRGRRYAQYELAFLKKIRQIGFLSRGEWLKCVVTRVPLRFLPPSLLSFLYEHALRRKK